MKRRITGEQVFGRRRKSPPPDRLRSRSACAGSAAADELRTDPAQPSVWTDPACTDRKGVRQLCFCPLLFGPEREQQNVRKSAFRQNELT